MAKQASLIVQGLIRAEGELLGRAPFVHLNMMLTECG